MLTGASFFCYIKQFELYVLENAINGVIVVVFLYQESERQ